MCDQDHFEQDVKEYEARGLVTRKQFGAMLGAGAIAMMLPKVANAVTVTESEVTIKTPDGTCDAYFVHPANGTGAGVLIWPDIFGLRPAMRTMAKRYPAWMKTLETLEAKKTVLLIDNSDNKNLDLASRNLPGVKLVASRDVNVYDLLGHQQVLLSEAAARKLSEGLQ